MNFSDLGEHHVYYLLNSKWATEVYLGIKGIPTMTYEKVLIMASLRRKESMQDRAF